MNIFISKRSRLTAAIPFEQYIDKPSRLPEKNPDYLYDEDRQTMPAERHGFSHESRASQNMRMRYIALQNALIKTCIAKPRRVARRSGAFLHSLYPQSFSAGLTENFSCSAWAGADNLSQLQLLPESPRLPSCHGSCVE